jgi:hypothetical protein
MFTYWKGRITMIKYFKNEDEICIKIKIAGQIKDIKKQKTY